MKRRLERVTFLHNFLADCLLHRAVAKWSNAKLFLSFSVETRVQVLDIDRLFDWYWCSWQHATIRRFESSRLGKTLFFFANVAFIAARRVHVHFESCRFRQFRRKIWLRQKNGTK